MDVVFYRFDVNTTDQTSRIFLRILAVFKMTVFCISPMLVFDANVLQSS